MCECSVNRVISIGVLGNDVSDVHLENLSSEPQYAIALNSFEEFQANSFNRTASIICTGKADA